MQTDVKHRACVKSIHLWEAFNLQHHASCMCLNVGSGFVALTALRLQDLTSTGLTEWIDNTLS